jgi:hypothetical protein
LAGVAGAVAAVAGLAGVAGAVAEVAGLASAFFSSFLAGSAAKAVTANAEAINVATNFMISFLLGYVEIYILHIYNAVASVIVYTILFNLCPNTLTNLLC